MSKKVALFFLLILAFSSMAVGQAYNLERHFTEEVLSMDQTDDGLFWLATPTGVAVYDLNHIRRVPYKNEETQIVLDTKKVVAIKNEVFSWTADDFVYRYDKSSDSFHPYYQGSRIHDIQVLNNQHLIVSDDYQIKKIDIQKNQEYLVFQSDKKSTSKNYNWVIACIKDQILLKEDNQLYSFENHKRKTLQAFDPSDLVIISTVNDTLYAVQNFTSGDKKIFIYDQKHALNDSLPFFLPGRPQVMKTSEGYLYRDDNPMAFSSDTKEVKELTIKSLDEEVNLSNYFLFQDHNSNLWVGMGKGLFLLNAHTSFYTFNKLADSYLQLNTDRVFVKDRINFLKLDENEKPHWFSYSPELNKTFQVLDADHPINSLNLSINVDKNFSLYSEERILHYFLEKKPQDTQVINHYLSEHNLLINKIHVPDSNLFIITNKDVLLTYDHQTKKIHAIKTPGTPDFKYTNYKYQGEESVGFLLSNSFAFYDYKRNTCQLFPLSDEQQHLTQYATDFYFFENKLYLTTRSKGLLVLDFDSNETHNYFNEGEELYSIFKDSKNNFWMNGNGFLSVYNYETNRIESVSFPKLDADSYFLKNAYKGDTFYISTQKYIVSVHTDQFSPYQPSNEVFINKIDYSASGRRASVIRPDKDEISLPAGSQNIRLYLFSPNFSLSKLRKIEFRINDGHWNFYQDFIEFNQNSFSHGDFNISVRDIESNELIFEKKINIKPYWYQTKLANIIFVLLIFGILFLFLILYRNKIKVDFKLRAIEERTRIKQDFVAKVSHEIRTPINAIVGFSDLLRNKLNDPESVKKYSETIYFSGNILLHLVNDILYKSSIDAKKIKFIHENFELHPLLNKLQEVFSLQFEEKQLQFFLEIDPSTPNLVNGDANKLTQVLSNLIQNAIKFTDEGSIYLRTKLKSKKGDRMTVDFSVTDTGVGIPEHLQHKLFQSFTQLHTASKPHEGTGLGLIITKEIVSMGGGEMYFTSKEGVGSTFGFLLPFDPADGTYTPEKLKKTAFAKNDMTFTVLIAEDEKFNSILINKLISDQYPKAVLTNVTNGIDAIAELESSTFDVIILDINMAKLGGMEVAHHIREKMKDRTKNLICCTASAEINERENVNKYFDYLVSKPYNKQDIYQAIEGVLDQKENQILK